MQFSRALTRVSTRRASSFTQTKQFTSKFGSATQVPKAFSWSPAIAVSAVGAAVGFTLYNSNPIFAEDKVPFYGIPGTNKERTFIAVKPDGTSRGIIGEIITRFEKKGYKLVGIKVVKPSEAHAAEHYADLSKKPFFPKLVKFFSSGAVVAMVWEGKDAIAGGRRLVGETDPAKSLPGSIRGDLCIEIGRNIIHGSDGPDSAKDEISLWFKPEEVADWDRCVDSWIYE